MTNYLNFFSKDIISVEQNLAAAFNLRTYETMVMNIVDPASVALDSVEITFKDQYMGRSEMWRLKSFLVRIIYTERSELLMLIFIRQTPASILIRKLNIVRV